MKSFCHSFLNSGGELNFFLSAAYTFTTTSSSNYHFISHNQSIEPLTTKSITMSSMRNAVHRRQHRERNQLPGREKWGILEKHKVPTYLPTYLILFVFKL